MSPNTYVMKTLFNLMYYTCFVIYLTGCDDNANIPKETNPPNPNAIDQYDLDVDTSGWDFYFENPFDDITYSTKQPNSQWTDHLDELLEFKAILNTSYAHLWE